MQGATKRSILRWIHLVVTIPVLGYIYGPAAEVQEYAGGVRDIFVPGIMLTGYWMYAGVLFAIIAVVTWFGAIHQFGFGMALLSQVALLIARKIWLAVRARRAT